MLRVYNQKGIANKAVAGKPSLLPALLALLEGEGSRSTANLLIVHSASQLLGDCFVVVDFQRGPPGWSIDEWPDHSWDDYSGHPCIVEPVMAWAQRQSLQAARQVDVR